MKYKKCIDSELKHIAKNVPYNKLIIRPANIYQTIAFKLTSVPCGIINRSVIINGYNGLKFKTDIFEPADVQEKLPCLIYVHGGAFSYKASAYHKKLACMYALNVRCRVCFPDYHLMPKYPYPAAYDDVLSLYKYVLENSEKLGVDDGKIGLAGDSAGASIAALICNNYKKEHLPPPCVQMLIYPLTDITICTDSMKRFSDTPLWNSQNNKRMWLYYCGNLSAEAVPVYAASPMHSSLPEIIPDTYIETAEYDCLHDEGVIYGNKLRSAGADVEINETAGTIHGYDLALNTKIAVSNIEKRILFLKKGFVSGYLP